MNGSERPPKPSVRMPRTGAIEGVDESTRRALNILTSTKIADALDLEKEDPRLRERYGGWEGYATAIDVGPDVLDQLRARLLV